MSECTASNYVLMDPVRCDVTASDRVPGFVVANGTLVVAAEARMYSFEDTSPHHLVRTKL